MFWLIANPVSPDQFGEDKSNTNEAALELEDEDELASLELEDELASLELEDELSTLELDDELSTLELEDELSTLELEDELITLELDDELSTLELEEELAGVEPATLELELEETEELTSLELELELTLDGAEELTELELELTLDGVEELTELELEDEDESTSSTEDSADEAKLLDSDELLSVGIGLASIGTLLTSLDELSLLMTLDELSLLTMGDGPTEIEEDTTLEELEVAEPPEEPPHALKKAAHETAIIAKFFIYIYLIIFLNLVF